MSPLLRTKPLPTEVDEALTKLEFATAFDGLADEYEIVDAEAKRRALPAFFAMVPAIAGFLVLIGLAQVMGWLPREWWGIYLLIVPFAAFVTNFLRGSQAAKDEQRMGIALDKFRMEAGVTAARKVQ